MSNITLHIPAPVAVPRGAELFAQVFDLVRSGWRLARRTHETRRDGDERRADAAALRRFAQLQMETDPRFAADLFAAADRHVRDI